MKKCDGNHSVAENSTCTDIECWEDINRFFNLWWHNEGSGMPPLKGEEACDHVQRVSRIAWHNGLYKLVTTIIEKEREPEASPFQKGWICGWNGLREYLMMVLGIQE
jgi:hypothetical protein